MSFALNQSYRMPKKGCQWPTDKVSYWHLFIGMLYIWRLDIHILSTIQRIMKQDQIVSQITKKILPHMVTIGWLKRAHSMKISHSPKSTWYELTSSQTICLDVGSLEFIRTCFTNSVSRGRFSDIPLIFFLNDLYFFSLSYFLYYFSQTLWLKFSVNTHVANKKIKRCRSVF